MKAKTKHMKHYKVAYEVPAKSGNLQVRHLLVEASDEVHALQLAGEILAANEKIPAWRTVSAKEWK